MALSRALSILTLALLLATSACSAKDSGNQQQAKAETAPVANAQPSTSEASANSAATQAASAAPGGEGTSPALYTELPSPVPSEAPPGKVEVIEFFLYTCPHCNHFEPIITPWSKQLPDYVYFHRVPASFGPHADMYARAHYAAIDLHVLDKFRPALFHALHAERRNIDTLDKLTALFTQATGIDAKTFTDTYNSFGVDNQVRRGKALNQAYVITGVPSLGVAGKYVVTPSSAKSFEGMLKVTDSLTRREHEASGK